LRAASRFAGGLLIAGGVSLLATGPAWARAVSVPTLTHVRVLSNETTRTTFSEAQLAARIWKRPTTQSRTITRLRFFTPDAEAVQTYLILRQAQVGRYTWDEIRVPMRPNGRTGWVRRNTLGSYQRTNKEIVVSRAKRRMTVYRAGRKVFQAPIGVGKPSTPTPPGHFWITESFPSQDPFYGPWAFGTSDYAHDTEFPDGSIVGIHGTDQPSLIPGDPSHGCIRMKDGDVLRLKKLIRIGTPVWIR
jgi:hypothetical protein